MWMLVQIQKIVEVMPLNCGNITSTTETATTDSYICLKAFLLHLKLINTTNLSNDSSQFNLAIVTVCVMK